MKLYYSLLLFLLVDIASCYKPQQNFNVKHQLASANTEVTSIKNAEKLVLARYKVNKRTKHEPGIEQRPLDYFPQMEYPTTVIETSKPFYFDSAASDSFLCAFPSEVISSYKSILLQRPKRLHNSQVNDTSIIKLTEEIKSICKDIINGKEKQISETENNYLISTNCNDTYLINNAETIDSVSEIQIYYQSNFDRTDKSFETIDKSNGSDTMGNTPESIQSQYNIFIDSNTTEHLNANNYKLDWLVKYIIETLLIDWIEDDISDEEDTVSEEEYSCETLNVLALLEILDGISSVIQNDTLKDSEEYSQDSMYSIETDTASLIPSYISELTAVNITSELESLTIENENCQSNSSTVKDSEEYSQMYSIETDSGTLTSPYNIYELTNSSGTSESESLSTENESCQSNSSTVNSHPMIKVPHIQPQFRTKYKNKILQRKSASQDDDL